MVAQMRLPGEKEDRRCVVSDAVRLWKEQGAVLMRKHGIEAVAAHGITVDGARGHHGEVARGGGGAPRGGEAVGWRDTADDGDGAAG